MNPVGSGTLLVAGLVLAAVAGPVVLRAAAPTLARYPRATVATLVAVTVVWCGTLLAVGPLMAWALNGPVWLPPGLAEMCQQCLASANPFSAGRVDTVVPTVVLLAAPALLAGLLASGLLVELRRRDTGARSARAWLRERIGDAAPETVLGHRVRLLPDEHPYAFTLPRRHGGIFLSTGALEHLTQEELTAVLAHEEAHVGQRHHLIGAVVAGLCRRLRFVPLLAAVDEALPHYLEIAADARARERSGTRALVGALVKVGDGSRALDGRPVGAALHVCGPDRIRHLVDPAVGAAGAAPTALVIAYLVALAAVNVLVHGPWAMAVLQGCL